MQCHGHTMIEVFFVLMMQCDVMWHVLSWVGILIFHISITYWHTSSCCPILSICRQSIMMHHRWYETCTCVCFPHISPIVIVHPHQKSWKSAQQSSWYHWCSFGLGFTVTSHIPDFITTLISLYFMNINFFHICFSLVSLDLLFPPVWEPFRGTLYHESILTPALPLMHCILIKALSMNWCCTQTSAILVVYWISSHSKSWYSSSLRNILLGLYSCNYSLRSRLYLTSDTIHV